MRAPFYLYWTATLMLGLAACNKAESPAEVQHDVDKAVQSADRKTDAADQRADVKITDAAVDAALAGAEGDHKVALAKCEALQGDAQKACKSQADADLETAKANANAIKSGPG